MARKIDKVSENALCKKLVAAVAKGEIDIHRDLHNTIRNDPNWAGVVTHCRVVENYRRFVYSLKDNSRVLVAHSVVDGKHEVAVRPIG